MKIAIITIATGRYLDFYLELERSIHTYFLKNHDKHIFLFTDRVVYLSDDVTQVSIQNLPWPLTTLLRFHYFRQIDLSGYDVAFYIDSDMLIVDEINEDIILPKSQFSAVIHPLKTSSENHFETNPLSTACTDATKNTPYYQACFFGGNMNAMCEMFKVLDNNIMVDLRNNIIAKWHDESHFNKYLMDKYVMTLGEEYAFPDPKKWKNYKHNTSPKIIHYNRASV